MRRREFIAGLGGAAAWPLAARTQQPAVPVIGFIRPGSPGNSTNAVAPFLQGLKETGYVEGQNLLIEYRWPNDQSDQLRGAMDDLIRRQVAVIVANGNTAAVAAKRATTTMPVVFVVGGDPVALGLVAGLSRPGGNLTGVGVQQGELVAKQLELLRDLVPKLDLVAYLVNPTNANSGTESAEAQAAGRATGKQILILKVSNESELDQAFATLIAQHAGAFMIGNDPFFNGHMELLATFAARHSLPTIGTLREYATAGGLMSYGSSLTYGYRQAGIYTGRILRGEKPTDLPVELAAKIELTINLKAAKALGLDFPPALMIRADEVIE
jgi:putative ABC transport system substrate-binding protein